ncbi:hypothetical protein OESDEN_23799, partial [Oesophagostomum dentatum]
METAEKEWGDIQNDLAKMEEIHNQYIKKLSELTKLQESCLKAVKHQRYILTNFSETLDKAQRSAKGDEKERFEKIQHGMTDARAKLQQMVSELPVQN